MILFNIQHSHTKLLIFVPAAHMHVKALDKIAPVRCGNPFVRAARVLGMLPGFKKSATPNESDEWRRQCRLEMHHACVKHIVDSINNFCDKNVHVLCADNKVKLGYPCLFLC